MAYFLGSEVEVCLTTEASGGSVAVADVSGKFLVSGTGESSVAYGINAKASGNVQFPDDALSDITGIDLGIGSMDEDVDYLGHRTPLKAEVHKQTTTTLTFKRKNPVFDTIYGGDVSGSVARWGVKNTKALYSGLEEPSTDFGYRLYIKLHKGTDPAEVLTIPHNQMTNNTVTLNADGTQEQAIEFTSSVKPLIAASGITVNTGVTL